MIRSTSSDTFCHPREAPRPPARDSFGLLSTDGGRSSCSDRGSGSRASRAMPFIGGLQPLREGHRRELLHRRLRDPRPRRLVRSGSSAAGVDQRLVGVELDRRASRRGRRRDRRRTRAGRSARPTARETPAAPRPESCSASRRRSSRISRIGILEQQHEDRELLVRARRERALRGQQPHVARDLASLEEIQKRSGTDHRDCR